MGSTRYTTGSGYTNADIEALEQRIAQANQALQSFNTTAATDEELRNRAENEYRPIYNAQVAEQEAARQTAQTTLDNTLGALNRQYGRDQESINKSYDTQLAGTNNAMLARGFNNSSLAVAMLNHSNSQRNRALENLAAERAAGESSAQAAYNNAMNTANAAIARLGSDLATNVDARYQALREADQNRVFQQIQAQNQLEQQRMEWEFQLAQLRQQAYSQYLSQRGSGGGGSSSGASASSTPPSATPPSSTLADMFNQNQGGSRAPAFANALISGLQGAIGGITSGVQSALNRTREGGSNK
jgi:hypothetical protein